MYRFTLFIAVLTFSLPTVADGTTDTGAVENSITANNTIDSHFLLSGTMANNGFMNDDEPMILISEPYPDHQAPNKLTQPASRISITVKKPGFRYFKKVPSLNLERHKFTRKLRVNGWLIGDSAYVGQTKVADKWGFGFVVDRGATKYGLNNRGMEFVWVF